MMITLTLSIFYKDNKILKQIRPLIDMRKNPFRQIRNKNQINQKNPKLICKNKRLLRKN